MATETGFGDQAFSTLSPHHQSPTRSTGAANKRKRESIDHDSSASRRHHSSRGDGGAGSSNGAARRSASQQHQFIDTSSNLHDASGTEGYMQAQHSGGNGAPPHPSTETHADHHFDLSALQQHSNASNSSQQSAHAAVANANMDTAAAALSHYTMSVPPHPAEAFLNTPTAGADNFVAHDPFRLDNDSGPDGSHLASNSNTPSNKPPVGSDEWHRQRKDSHKEVERRRRETINEGINELAKIVPGTEKNKGTILQRAVQYIKSLHDDASANIDKWTFEKLVTEQAISELSDKITRAYEEREAWKRIAQEAGVDVNKVDLGLSISRGSQSQQQQPSHTDMDVPQENVGEGGDESEEDGDEDRDAVMNVSAALTAALDTDDANPEDDNAATAVEHGDLPAPEIAEEGADVADDGGDDEHLQPDPTSSSSPITTTDNAAAVATTAEGGSRAFRAERQSTRRGRSARS